MKIEPLVINHATGDSGDYIDVVSGHTFGPKGGVTRAQLHKRVLGKSSLLENVKGALGPTCSRDNIKHPVYSIQPVHPEEYKNVHDIERVFL